MKKIKQTFLEKITFPMTIPESIDIERMLELNPPVKTSVNHDAILYVINLIHRKMHAGTKNNTYKEDGFIAIKSEYIHNILPLWDDVKKYLLENNVIECDNHWERGTVSLGYRLNSKFLGNGLKLEYFQSSKLYFRIAEINSEEKRFQDMMKRMRKHLFIPFINESITIDGDGALNWLRKYYKVEITKINDDNKIPDEVKQDKIKHLKMTYKLQKEKIIEITKFNYTDNLSFDKNGHRFHSYFTNLKKELRKFIKIDDEEVVQIDLKNSQPFLFYLFLNQSFWSTRNDKIIKLRYIDREYYKYLSNNDNYYPYMMIESPQNLAGFDNTISRFIQIVSDGKLYDYFLEGFRGLQKENDIEKWNEERKKMKKSVLCIFYDAPRKINNNPLYRFFRAEFPAIEAYIRHLKSFETKHKRWVRKTNIRLKKGVKITSGNRYKYYDSVDGGFIKLCTTLQRIESNIFLDRIAERIQPLTNFITVHDSIIIPKSKTAMVYDIMMEEIENAVGIKPVLDVEDLKPIPVTTNHQDKLFQLQTENAKNQKLLFNN